VLILKVLIDTNVFIHREGDKLVPDALRDLEKYLKDRGHTIVIHPLSEKEIRNDPRKERRRKAESKVETYPRVEFPSYPNNADDEFRRHVSEAADFNERVDNALLYSVYDDTVDFLVTEDKGIHRKAIDLGLSDQVFNIKEGRDFFEPSQSRIRGPQSIEKTKVSRLDVSDPIFDSLKEDYPNFTDWLESHPDRTAWINRNPDGSLGALLILKPNEVQEIGVEPVLGPERRLKISTLKVSEDRWGSKIGELLISIAIREALYEGNEVMYLTYFLDEEDYFVDLIRSYGFEYVSDKENGEAIFLKRLKPGPGDNPDPLETTRRFYPSFYDGPEVDKFLVPIQPVFHNKLFTAYAKRQPPLGEFTGQFNSEGNAIKKAYLTGAKNKQLEPGDILLFYRSEDHKEVTSLGVCERLHYRLTDPDEIIKSVGKRSVFTDSEIENMAQSPTSVILFWWHFDLENPISYSLLREEGILDAPLQVLQAISEQDYKFIKQEGGIDERFALD